MYLHCCSVTKPRPPLCNPMNCSAPGFSDFNLSAIIPEDLIQRFSRKLPSLVEAVVTDLKARPFGYGRGVNTHKLVFLYAIDTNHYRFATGNVFIGIFGFSKLKKEKKIIKKKPTRN